MKRLVLAARIAGEMDEIYQYTLKTFGAAQAERYLDELNAAFRRIQENESIGRERDDILEGFRSLTVGGHIIFYRVSNIIEIVGVPHGGRDIGRYFAPRKNE